MKDLIQKRLNLKNPISEDLEEDEIANLQSYLDSMEVGDGLDEMPADERFNVEMEDVAGEFNEDPSNFMQALPVGIGSIGKKVGENVVSMITPEAEALRKTISKRANLEKPMFERGAPRNVVQVEGGGLDDIRKAQRFASRAMDEASLLDKQKSLLKEFEDAKNSGDVDKINDLHDRMIDSLSDLRTMDRDIWEPVFDAKTELREIGKKIEGERASQASYSKLPGAANKKVKNPSINSITDKIIDSGELGNVEKIYGPKAGPMKQASEDMSAAFHKKEQNDLIGKASQKLSEMYGLDKVDASEIKEAKSILSKMQDFQEAFGAYPEFHDRIRDLESRIKQFENVKASVSKLPGAAKKKVKNPKDFETQKKLFKKGFGENFNE